ncbi:MAG: hypothetical protein IH948_09740 [Bacteroidetes bacterium]|nr:hypothetical protein [Bacteroidota bacterium]
MKYLVKPKTSSIPNILKAFFATCKNYYREAESYQKFAYLAGLILIVGGLLHVIPLAFDGFQWSGAVSFRKPIAFGLALGLNAWSLAWVMTYLPKRKKTSWFWLGVYLLAAYLEFIPITIQVWRGEASHFNHGDPLSAALWSIMGLVIVGLVFAVFFITIWSFTSLKAPSNYGWAIKIGMLILAVGQGFGQWIISNAGDILGAEGVAVLPAGVSFEDASTYGLAGNMKLIHFLSLHAIQFLPVLAILTQYTDWNEAKKRDILLLAAAGYIGLMIVVFDQVFNGRALFDLNIFSAIGLFGTFALMLVTYLITYVGMLKKFGT